MDSKKVASGIRDRVAAEMVKANFSKRALAIESGIPLTTLDRRLRDGENFTAREMALIAEALQVPFVALLPDALKEDRQKVAA